MRAIALPHENAKAPYLKLTYFYILLQVGIRVVIFIPRERKLHRYEFDLVQCFKSTLVNRCGAATRVFAAMRAIGLHRPAAMQVLNPNPNPGP